ncbi:MAG TPA: hypothetical protein VGZ22_30790, partial [Isosphaeraceae bacterium]|nr:hypothetical protein [Isosphaeraceae bacterium]
LSDQTFVAAASAYLAHLANVKPAQDPATGATSASAPSPGSPAPLKSAEPAALGTKSTTTAQAEPAPPVVVPHDPTAWRPFAALLVTGLGVPLAYWGRMSLFSLGAYVRASLPGPGPSPKSLPPASGA